LTTEINEIQTELPTLAYISQMRMDCDALECKIWANTFINLHKKSCPEIIVVHHQQVQEPLYWQVVIHHGQSEAVFIKHWDRDLGEYYYRAGATLDNLVIPWLDEVHAYEGSRST
jgi:hypothetical protein